MTAPSTSILRPQERSIRRFIVPITLNSSRDAAVDVIKGAACALMTVAHVPFAQAPWLHEATMAAVLFFASTGMNLEGIVERRPGEEKRLAANAFFLIFAGFADNYVQGTVGSCDVFQIAGLAMLAMLFLRHVSPRRWTWLFPLPFLLHLANQHFHWKIAAGGLSSFFLTPGLFPLFPWLSFYLLGAHLKVYKTEKHAWLNGAAAAGLLALLRVFQPFQFHKFWMSPDYFLIGCVAISFSFAGLRRGLTPRAEARLIEVRRWGAYSLVFYIINNFVIRVLQMFGLGGVNLLVLAVLLTAVLLRPALSLQRWTGRSSPVKALLGSALIACGALAAAGVLWHDSFYLRTLTAFGLTFAFVAAYPAWKNISRATWGSAAKEQSTGSKLGLAESH
jgi:hypothetical protein